MNKFLAIIGIFTIVLAMFLVAREAFNWYWKINARLDVLKKIENELKENNKKLDQLFTKKEN